MKARFLTLAAMAALGFLPGYLMGLQGPRGAAPPPAPSPVAAAPAQGPRIRLVEERFDFGTVPQGQKVQHTFRFRNEGSGPLVISDVTTSCGCTATILTDRTLAPGEEGAVQTEFDSEKYADRIQIRINVFSNDPARQVATAYLEGKVDAALRVSPSEVEIGPLRSGSEGRGSFRVASAAGHGKFRVLGFESTSGLVVAGPAREVAPRPGQEDAAFEVPVRVLAQAPYGSLWDRVTVRTDGKPVEVKVTRTVVEVAP